MIVSIRHFKWFRWGMKFPLRSFIKLNSSKSFNLVLLIEKLFRLVVIEIRLSFLRHKWRSISLQIKFWDSRSAFSPRKHLNIWRSVVEKRIMSTWWLQTRVTWVRIFQHHREIVTLAITFKFNVHNPLFVWGDGVRKPLFFSFERFFGLF